VILFDGGWRKGGEKGDDSVTPSRIRKELILSKQRCITAFVPSETPKNGEINHI
jgi:hypothetical protein